MTQTVLHNKYVTIGKITDQLNCTFVFFKGASTRPCNPTPGHATGQGSPAPLRPKNPTPVHAAKNIPDRPGTQLFRPGDLVKSQLTNVYCMFNIDVACCCQHCYDVTNLNVNRCMNHIMHCTNV